MNRKEVWIEIIESKMNVMISKSSKVIKSHSEIKKNKVHKDSQMINKLIL